MAQLEKNLPAMQETQVQYPGSIPGLGVSPGKENGNPLQYCCLGNPMDKGAQRTTDNGVARPLGSRKSDMT